MAAPRTYTGTFCTGHVPMVRALASARIGPPLPILAVAHSCRSCVCALQVGTTAIQFSENTMHEFIEEYKSAHGLKEKTGPGRAKIYDPRAQPRRPSPKELPLTGCTLARLGTGQHPARQAATSSKAIGGWWDDPIFKGDAKLKDVVLQPGEKGPLPPCMQKRDLMTTASEVGQYWFDPIVSDADPEMAKKRAQNGIRRLLPVESASQFALDDLPTEHRML